MATTSTTAVSSFTMAAPHEAALMPLVIDLAMALEPGDVVTLSGDLGSGKTAFARSLIRYLAGDAELEVPSPTFTLLQIYELPRFSLVHVDLYRIAEASELHELGIDDLPGKGVVLLEWPERAADTLPPDRFDVTFVLMPEHGRDFREVRLTGYGACAARVERLHAARRFLEQAGFGTARRERITGDASTRLYERLTLGERRVILMNAPRRPDGPPVKDGKPYSAIAHLAEDTIPFVAMAQGLRAKGFSAPAIYAADLAEGFVVLEDLGSDAFVAGDPPTPIKSRYEAAVHVLVALHKQVLPTTLPVAPQVDYRLPTYDAEAFLIEAELLPDWYLAHCGAPIQPGAHELYLSLWREALQPALEAPKTWVLRDFHSPNLLWLPDRRGIACVGLLDFQDALLGPAAYDLASLLQDARVDVPEAIEIELVGRYVRARLIDDPAFDVAAFARVYATLAAQRASKVLGIFARLNRRDGKPHYLRHLPRVYAYLQRALAHSSLVRLRDWYQRHVPPPPAA